MSSRKAPHGKTIEGVHLGEPQKIINIHKEKQTKLMFNIPRVPEIFSHVRQDASVLAKGRSHCKDLTEHRKPCIKSLWHPGYV